MKHLLLCLFTLLLSLPSFAQFELPQGRWQGPIKGKGLLTVEIGNPRDKTFRFTFEPLSADVKSAVARGTYRVTSNKGQSHVTLQVEKVDAHGSLVTDAAGGLDFGGWKMWPGQPAPSIFRFDDSKLELDMFDPETRAHIQRIVLQSLGR